jgi:hypothetical protein
MFGVVAIPIISQLKTIERFRIFNIALRVGYL